ncbi:endonuclease/exonuclease/phosphatase family protein [Pseudoalteromonas sp. JC3]|uniref:endonuclease/exonuclease/phosphatase family protein n=1 Tax=Pseudoalteromonas sp. JC3 TaxID=2810196 RepID=UPI0019D16FB2|nr:endonuclease/exonuclease/phosphatase family protein [Pseudoalteromonas sp. JC3]MBR8842413.1 endonuclease/exonuclease/phosphatase family protein [Pseudoalteromonas sp. JC3]WJE09468.1 hypothetical protein QSH61_03060 [Pseudoalteromonas sp. JC3]
MLELKFICVNISNPSYERAKLIWEELKVGDFDVVCLTETKSSKGCEYIIDESANDGYKFFGEKPKGKDYGSFILVREKKGFEALDCSFNMGYMPERVSVVNLECNGRRVYVVNVYIPSRDRSEGKIKRKKLFLSSLKEGFLNFPTSGTVFCGDFNLVSRGHFPKYYIFKDWEYDFFDYLSSIGFVDSYNGCENMPYSWIGRTGNGYRYDYAYVGSEVNVLSSVYSSELLERKLTDHREINLKLKV